LVRVNAHTERFEHSLTEAKVRFVVRGAERFYDRPEVRKALVLLRGAARAESAGADSTLDGWSLTAAVRHVLSGAGMTAEPPSERGAARERWESLSAIVALAEDLAAADGDASLAGFSAELARRAETGHAPVATAVTLATMHAAKGLEWDAVLLPGLVEGIMPIVHARTAEAIEEERRLLYVAVTRARKHLLFSWAPARGPGAPQTRQRSRFLAAMFPAGVPASQRGAAP
jgi:DNA helicase-2/ATP-dependent DNA helicase PcrA